MAISMYQASVPQFVKMLTNLSNILKKGEEFAGTKGIDSAALVEGCLAPDMFPLSKQVQIACDQVKNGMARLAGVEPPKFEDNETTFAQLQDRIAKTIAFANSLKPAQVGSCLPPLPVTTYYSAFGNKTLALFFKALTLLR